MTELSAQFADRILAIEPAALERADYDQVARLLFDAVGCAYGGTQQQIVSALSRWVAAFDGAGPAGVVASRLRVPTSYAALVNGTAAHSYELDDTHDPSMSHPASVVIPTALAVAVECNSSGRDFVAAIVAGYEAMARIGMAANASHVIEYGWHPTALFGAFGATAAAAKLKGLDSKGLRGAWGHVLSMTSGAMQFSDESTGTAVKRLHAGFAAQQGVLATEITVAGIEGPQHAFDGKYNFFKLYGRDPRPELLAETPAHYAIHDISFKPYSCCRQFHSMIDGLRETTDNFVRTSAIKDITVRGPRVLSDQHMLRRPASPMAAQYSLPFVVGATLEFGPTRFDAFALDHLNDAKILRWADLVQVEYDEDLQRQYPEHFGTEVEIGFADGTRRKRRLLDSLGTPARPFTWDYLREKAKGLTAPCRPPLDFDRLQAAVQGLSNANDVGLLDRLFTGDAAQHAGGRPPNRISMRG